MSLTAQEHALLLGRLLPQGPAWPTTEKTNGLDDFHLLLESMAQEPARVGADYDLILEELFPDNELTDLDSWERVVGPPPEALTNEERLDRIRAILNGPGSPTLTILELFAKLMAGNPDVRMYHRVGPRSATGAGQCGDRLRTGEWDFTALCELMPSALGVGPDDFEAWTNVSTATVAVSPVTLTPTADVFPMPPIAWGFVETPLVGTQDGDTVYTSVWIRSNIAEQIGLGFLGRDGVTSGTVFECTPGIWHRLQHEGPIGTGLTPPLLRVTSQVGAAVVAMSWAVAGVRDQVLQDLITARFPIHTSCHFGVIGEYATLLSKDPNAVNW